MVIYHHKQAIQTYNILSIVLFYSNDVFQGISLKGLCEIAPIVPMISGLAKDQERNHSLLVESYPWIDNPQKTQK